MRHITVVIESSNLSQDSQDPLTLFRAKFFSDRFKMAEALDFPRELGALDFFSNRLGVPIPVQEVIEIFLEHSESIKPLSSFAPHKNFVEIIEKIMESPDLWSLQDSCFRVSHERLAGVNIELGKVASPYQQTIFGTALIDPKRKVTAKLSIQEIQEIMPLFDSETSLNSRLDRFLDHMHLSVFNQDGLPIGTEFRNLFDLYWFQCIRGSAKDVYLDWGPIQEEIALNLRFNMQAYYPDFHMWKMFLPSIYVESKNIEIGIGLSLEANLILTFEGYEGDTSFFDRLGWSGELSSRTKYFEIGEARDGLADLKAYKRVSENMAAELCQAFGELGLEPKDFILGKTENIVFGVRA